MRTLSTSSGHSVRSVTVASRRSTQALPWRVSGGPPRSADRGATVTAAVVGRTPLGAPEEWHVHGLSGVEDRVAMYGDGVDAIGVSVEAEQSQRGCATLLKKFAHDAICFEEGKYNSGLRSFEV
jgi:hypothetical protein